MESVIAEQGGGANPLINRIALVQGDITQQAVDAIVTVIPQNLEYKGSLNRSILTAAGQQLDELVLEHIYKPKPGDAYAIPPFSLPCRHVIFTVLPYWRADFDKDDRQLVACVRKALELAVSMELSSIAFPPVGAGQYGFPKARAARLILRGIQERLSPQLSEIRIVCPDAETLGIFRERLQAVGWRG